MGTAGKGLTGKELMLHKIHKIFAAMEILFHVDEALQGRRWRTETPMSDHGAATSPAQWRRVLGAIGILIACLVLPSSLVLVDDAFEQTSSLPLEKRISRFIAGYAKQYRLEPALLRAVIKVESDFNPTAVSPKGAQGLMQLMPPTAAALNVLDPFDPNENIRAGARELRRLLDRFGGNLRLALAAYHAGEARITRSVGVPPFRSTKRYVGDVLRYYRMFTDEQVKAP